MSLETYVIRPTANPNIRCRWVYDPDHQTRGSYAYDTEEETRAAEDEEIAKLESGEWLALGCIVQHRCDKCSEWHDADSLWSIVIGGGDAELDDFARHSMKGVA